MTGPYETEQQVRELPAVRVIYDATHARHRRGVMGELGYRLLEEACEAASVKAGTYDHRILIWLAGFEPETCAVVAALLSRAQAAGSARPPGSVLLTAAEAVTARQALADASAWRACRAGARAAGNAGGSTQVAAPRTLPTRRRPPRMTAYCAAWAARRRWRRPESAPAARRDARPRAWPERPVSRRKVQAPGTVELRLSSNPGDTGTLISVLERLAAGLPVTTVRLEILHRSGARTSRRDPGERTYVLVRVTAAARAHPGPGAPHEGCQAFAARRDVGPGGRDHRRRLLQPHLRPGAAARRLGRARAAAAVLRRAGHSC